VDAWSNGGYSSDPSHPDYGTHDWLAQHALDWLPSVEKEYIINNLASYLYGTELPDNGNAPDGIGDTGKHHFYFFSDGTVQDDSAAARASTEFLLAFYYLKQGNDAMAAKYAGVMVHYISDVAVFGHVMGSGTDWGNEIHHSDYEDYVNSKTSTYNAEFNMYLSFDGTLTDITAYDAVKELAFDTTFDVNGDLTCVWMDNHYNWNDQTFVNRAGESLNLAANYIADVLHSIYLLFTAKTPTSLECSVSTTEITLGSTITVSGSINPIIPDKTVTLTYRKPDANTLTRTVTTDSEGTFTDSYKPDTTGSWGVSAAWTGDQNYEGSSSSQVSFTVKKSGCLIATATYESELSPQVQFLREFRDNIVLKTFAGRCFMEAFNAWYYSFSPTIASVISESDTLKVLMKILLYPLIGILHISYWTYLLLDFSCELGVVVAGLVASSLIGVVYLTPWSLLFNLKIKFKPSKKVIRFAGLLLLGSILTIAFAEALGSISLMMMATSIFVVISIFLSNLVLIKAIAHINKISLKRFIIKIISSEGT
jgi:hypothetical protein